MLRGAPASTPNRRRRSEVATFTAPVAGWISNRSLSVPDGDGAPQGASVLENFFPTATGCILRRGSSAYAQIGSQNLKTVSLFKYVVGENSRMFGANDTTVYDITSVVSPVNFSLSVDQGNDLLGDDNGNTIGENSTEGLEVFENALSGDWITTQFGTTGGNYLIGVNGASTAFIFDGEEFYPYSGKDVVKVSYDGMISGFNVGSIVTGDTSGATGKIYKIIPGASPGEGTLILTDKTGPDFQNNEALTGSGGGAAFVNGAQIVVVTALKFPSGYTQTTADLSFVWVYKEALFFIEKNSLRAWYLEPDMVGGELKVYPLNGYLDRGGSLLWGQSWSLSSSDQGGLSSQNVFTSTEGECAVFQGISPADTTWSPVGTYRVGKPLGKHGFIRAGGDIVIATDVGDIALSKAVQVDFSVLAPNAVSYPINVDWNDAITRRGRNWQCEVWPEGQMAIVIPPNTDFDDPVWFVSNANTGAWAPFKNWKANCVLAWNGRLYYGSDDGLVIQAMVGGSDLGKPYAGVYVPLFSDVGKPTANKVARMARIEARSRSAINEKISCIFDFDTNISAPPGAAPVPIGNEWNNAIWDQSVWNAERNSVVTRRRHSVSGNGYKIAPVLQIASASTAPLDAEIITLDVTFESGDAFT